MFLAINATLDSRSPVLHEVQAAALTAPVLTAETLSSCRL